MTECHIDGAEEADRCQSVDFARVWLGDCRQCFGISTEVSNGRGNGCPSSVPRELYGDA
jgi:hypothetical protein